MGVGDERSRQCSGISTGDGNCHPLWIEGDAGLWRRRVRAGVGNVSGAGTSLAHHVKSLWGSAMISGIPTAEYSEVQVALVGCWGRAPIPSGRGTCA